ncbi:malonyl-CoA synthase [Labrys sp. KB_33_2]|uniref:malonate--CoA ligase n=1 Tax=Labrys sp. KB_33_2 TaxID=3237479 RepID=UPI003F92D658
MSNHLFSLIRSRMPEAGRPFLTLSDGSGFDYGAVLAWSGRYANALRGYGVETGDRVVVQVEKSPQAVFLYLACLRAGAVFVPLNTAYTKAELDYFVGDAEPRLLVCAPEKADELGEIGTRLGAAVATLGSRDDGSLAEAARSAPEAFDDVARGEDDLAALLYTSGTTGRSKGAMLTHGNLASNAVTLAAYWRFSQADVLLHALPIFHTHGLFVAINTTLMAGSSLIFLTRFDAAEVLRHLPEATCMMGVPTFYVRLLQQESLTAEATAHMRLFVSGSAPLLSETHEQWRARTGHAILERYGMTETNMITSNPYDGARVAGAVGMPLPGISLRIARPETGEALLQGEIGMIEVKGPNVFKGYWRMPEKTKSEFRPDGFFITGDLGKIDAQGYVHIVGRGKDLVITGGYNVYPKEVETEIDGIPGVFESAVIGVPHADFGEGVTAIVVRKPGATVEERTILQTLEGRLAKFKQPKRVLFVDELPRNTMGKVQKNVLQTTYRDLYARG